METQKRPLIIATVAAVVLGGAATAYWLTRQNIAKPINILESAALVPDEALMTGYITGDSQAWGRLQQFGTPEAQKIVFDWLQSLQSRILKDSNVDFNKDISPWMSGMTFALLPQPAANNQPNLLLVIGIKNKVAALEFANRLKSQNQATFKEANYQGVAVNQIREKNGTSYSSAVIGDYLVVSLEEKTIQAAIDTFKGQASFAKKASATPLLVKDTGLENPLAQFYVTDYSELIKQYYLSKPNAPKTSPLALKQLEEIKGVVGGFGVDTEGVRFKTKVLFNPQTVRYEFKPTAGKIVGQFPVQTMALVSGSGLNKYWSDWVKDSQSNPELKKSVDNFRAVAKNTTNLDVDKELFNWMDGEFGLGLIASKEGLLSEFGLGSALIVQTTNRQAADAAVAKLNTVLRQSLPFLSSEDKKIEGRNITEWKVPQGTILTQGWLNDNSLFITVGPLANLLFSAPANSLKTSANFKKATSSLPSSNQGGFYMDMDKTVSVLTEVSQKSGNPFPPETITILNSMNSVALSSHWLDASTPEFDMLFSLKKR